MALSSPKAGLAGTWEGTNYGTCLKGLCIKRRKRKKTWNLGAPCDSVSPCRCGIRDPLCNCSHFSSFPHSDGLVPDYYLCERGRDRLGTENGLRSFKNLWTLKEKRLSKLNLLQRTPRVHWDQFPAGLRFWRELRQKVFCHNTGFWFFVFFWFIKYFLWCEVTY